MKPFNSSTWSWIRSGTLQLCSRIRRQASAAWLFCRPFFSHAASSAGILLAETTREVVLNIETSLGDEHGDVKRAQALELIRERLLAEGVELATTTINAAIEAAVAELRRRGGAR